MEIGSRIFYSGIQTTQKAFATGIGKALDHWIVNMPRSLFFGTEKHNTLKNNDVVNKWSVLGSLHRGLCQNITTLIGALDQIWGNPSRYPYNDVANKWSVVGNFHVNKSVVSSW